MEPIGPTKTVHTSTPDEPGETAPRVGMTDTGELPSLAHNPAARASAAT